MLPLLDSNARANTVQMHYASGYAERFETAGGVPVFWTRHSSYSCQKPNKDQLAFERNAVASWRLSRRLAEQNLLAADLEIICSLVRSGRPRDPVLVHRVADLLHALRPHLAMTPLPSANPSLPSGWLGALHKQSDRCGR